MAKKKDPEHNWKTEEEGNVEDLKYRKDNEIEEFAKPKKRKPRNPNFLSFEDAKAFVREEMLHSRGAYQEWWDKNKPKTVSRWPHRVYRDEWVSWNDFLGNNNEFGLKTKKWRSMEEAMFFVHKLQLKSHTEWMVYAKSDDMPDDIPPRPDIAYSKWRSWNHWLGNKPQQAIEAKQIIEKIKVFFIIKYPDSPSNVFTFGVEEGGLHAMRERWEYEDSKGYPYKIVRFFWYDSNKQNEIHTTIQQLTVPYYEDDRQKIVGNVNEVIWRLQFLMEEITSLV